MARRLALSLAIILVTTGCATHRAAPTPVTWVSSDQLTASMVTLTVDGQRLSGTFSFAQLTTLGAPVQTDTGTISGTIDKQLADHQATATTFTATLEPDGTTVTGTLDDDRLQLGTRSLAPGSADFYTAALATLTTTATNPTGLCTAPDSYPIAACDDPSTTLAVLGTSLTNECETVAGATRSFTPTGGPEFCLADKTSDPTRAINGAMVGDCLAVVGGAAQRTPCDATDAVYVVLARFADVAPGAEAATCQPVAGSVGHVAWTWDSDTTPATSIDVLLCIGPRA